VNHTPIVQTRNVNREFRVGAETVHAVQDVSLSVQQGEFVALIGRSGSGKTTLLNLIAGLDRPTSGVVEIEGRDITRYSEKQLTELRRHKVGFVFQSFGLLPLLSAEENVEIALRIAGAGLRDRKRRSAELMELVGLAGRASHRPYELSGGEQQRVAIARSLANRPALVLADEPTGELDSSTAVSIFRLLRQLVDEEGVTIITTTHDRTVMEMAPRVEEMMDGRLLSPEEQELFAYTTREERSHFAAELPVDVREEVSAGSLPPPEVRHVVRRRELPGEDEPGRWAPERGEPAAEPAPQKESDAARPEADAPATRDGDGPPDFRPPDETERPRWARRE